MPDPSQPQIPPEFPDWLKEIPTLPPPGKQPLFPPVKQPEREKEPVVGYGYPYHYDEGDDHGMV